jgi:hypothetical protein
MSKHTNVNPDHYKSAGRERQGDDVVHEVERREAKRLESERRRADAKTGRAEKTGGPVGISNRMSPSDEARDAAQHPPLDTNAPPPEDAAGRVGEQPLENERERDRQTSLKAGSRSMAQKEAGTRHPDDPTPAARRVSGAFGREGDAHERRH